MPLKLTRRPGSAHWYIRGTVRGIAVFESTGTDREDAAEEIRIRRENALLDQSIHGKRATITFLEAAVSYLANGGSARFMGEEDEGGKWSGLIGHFGTTKLATIGQDDLDAAATALLPKAAPETRNRQCYTPFIAVWNHAVRNKWADARSWARPRKLKGTAVRKVVKRSGTRPTTYDEAAKFVLAMSPAPAMVMTALFYTGMRPIEMFSLDADRDIIMPDQQWLVLESTKTGEPRGIPLHPFIVPMFAALVKRGGPLFRTPRGNPYPMTEDGGGQLKTAIIGARRRTKIADISPYTARHTVSTQLVVNGVHEHIKDQILGHAATSMSRHYTAVPQAPLIEAISTLPVPDAWKAAPWVSDPLSWQGRLAHHAGLRAFCVQSDSDGT